MQTTAQIDRKWHVIDAKDVVLGQMATEAAIKLMGKHKPTYTPHIDGGDFVVVINAKEVVLTGNKEARKMYYDHSSFPGGIRTRNTADVRAKKPEELVTRAIYSMLPKNRLRSGRMGRLKVYAGAEHPHQGQVAGK